MLNVRHLFIYWNPMSVFIYPVFIDSSINWINISVSPYPQEWSAHKNLGNVNILLKKPYYIFQIYLNMITLHTAPLMDINWSTATKLKFTCIKGLPILSYHAIYLNVLMGYSLPILKLKTVIKVSPTCCIQFDDFFKLQNR